MQSNTILMFLYGPIETDGRVLRSIKAISELGNKIILVSCGSNKNFTVEGVVKHYNFHGGIGAFAFFRFIFKVFILSIRLRTKIDLFYLHDYYSTVFAFLVRLLNKPFIYDAHELIIKRRNENVSARDKFFIWSERCNIRHAKFVIEANKEREKIIRLLYKIQNTTNVLNITERKKHNEPSDIVREKIIVYQGTLSQERNLHFFIEALEEIDSSFRLMLIGDGPERNELESFTKQKRLEERVVFTGRLPNNAMLDLLQKCMIGIISYPSTSLNTLYCSPNKIFEYASYNLPMISTDQPFMYDVFREYHIGEIFKENNILSFADSFKKIIDNYEMYQHRMNDFLSFYNWENEKIKIQACVKNTMNK